MRVLGHSVSFSEERQEIMKRIVLFAALAAATAFGGAKTASADTINIQFTNFVMTGGNGVDELGAVTIDNDTQAGTFFGTAVNLDSSPSSFTISDGTILVDLTFNSPLMIQGAGALRSYLAVADTAFVNPTFIPAGQVITSALFSLSTTTYVPSTMTGSYSGTITITTAAVPEPASMVMASMGLGLVGVARRIRRRNV